MKRQIALLLAVCTLSGLLFGCGKKPEETVPPTTAPTLPATEAPTEATQPTVPATEPTEPALINPLTGEKTEEDMSSRRPYAVVINNISVAQPQCGTSQASVLYEVLAEGGITRMLAIFSDISKAENIGSIRSLRPYMLSICRSYDGLLVHAGGSTQAYKDAKACGIEHMDGVNGGRDAGYFYRDPSRMSAGYEHSMFIHGADILDCTEALEYRTELNEKYPGFGLHFAEEAAPENGRDASFIDINFRDGKHTKFNLEDSGLYSMDQYGADYIDGTTREEVCFRNVLVLFAKTWDEPDPGESYTRVFMELTGSGTGYFACGGKVTDIYWTREGEDAPFRYYLDEAHTKPLTLGVGTSYVGIVPTNSVKPVFE